MTTTSHFDTLGEQVAKLLPMLSSTNDGEALAAVRAIGRRLQAAGRDWHWLAAQVASSASTPAPPQRRRTPSQDDDEPVSPSRYQKAAEATARTAEREQPQAGWSSLKRSEALLWTVLLDGQPWLKPAEAELVATTRASLHDGLAFHLTAGQKRTLTALIHDALERGLTL